MNKAVRQRCFTPLFGLISALGLLAGCAGNGAAPPVSPAAAKPQAAAPETAALPTPAPDPTPAPPPEPEINAPAPAAVIGWSTASLNEAFGAASLVRHDLGAEIWQYRTKQCVLLLFLYPKDGGPLAVNHLDVGDGGDVGACLKSVVRNRIRRSTG